MGNAYAVTLVERILNLNAFPIHIHAKPSEKKQHISRIDQLYMPPGHALFLHDS